VPVTLCSSPPPLLSPLDRAVTESRGAGGGMVVVTHDRVCHVQDMLVGQQSSGRSALPSPGSCVWM
jgi:hypothetical protein